MLILKSIAFGCSRNPIQFQMKFITFRYLKDILTLTTSTVMLKIDVSVYAILNLYMVHRCQQPYIVSNYV